MANVESPEWGRVFINGGVDWLKLGQKSTVTPGA